MSGHPLLGYHDRPLKSPLVRQWTEVLPTYDHSKCYGASTARGVLVVEDIYDSGVLFLTAPGTAATDP